MTDHMQTGPFRNPEDGILLSREELSNANHETQIKVMRHWFFCRYEHPSNSTPHSTQEGGFHYIHGGPYDAQEELDEAFAECVPDAVITQLVDELEDQSGEWAPKQ